LTLGNDTSGVNHGSATNRRSMRRSGARDLGRTPGRQPGIAIFGKTPNLSLPPNL
jgi:hypothetical protein